MPENSVETYASIFELILIASGLLLLWRFVIRPAWRRDSAATTPRLAPWNVTLSDFLLCVFVIFGGGFFGSFLIGQLLQSLHFTTDTKAILSSAALQFGLLIGAALVPLGLGHFALRAPFSRAELVSGAATFLITLPVVTLANLAGLGVLKLTGLPAEQQDLLRMFEHADSPMLQGLMIVLATIVAPVAEELFFRATIFRYLRTRWPRWIALILPGVLFATLHVNWTTLDGLASFVPLATLAVVFSIAYERTGRIGTVMIAHGLFNLHTIVLLFAGVTS